MLYLIQVDLYSNDDHIDSKSKRVGLRTVELLQEKDETGSSFKFKLNGKDLFVKGGNYIPTDMFMPRVTKSDYSKIV